MNRSTVSLTRRSLFSCHLNRPLTLRHNNFNQRFRMSTQASASATPKHFKIVGLESEFTPLGPVGVPKPHTFSLTEYQTTLASEVADRIQDADIVITTIVKIRDAALSLGKSPNLKLICVMASGCDSIDLAACRARGICVLNSPDCNVDAVAEHATSLFFSVRRSIPRIMHLARQGQWPVRGTLMTAAYSAGKPPRPCREEIAVIVGYGGVGRQIEKVFRTLGMKIVIAARKGVTPTDGRVGFEEALRMATVLVVCCPRTAETNNMISDPEFAMMHEEAVLINVARGGIVNEEALFKALREEQISGAAVDVFDQEPASPETTILLRPEVEGLNLVTTAHSAWIGTETLANYQRVLQENIDGWIQGEVNPRRVKA